jgi:hypothetical protein
MFHWLMLTSQTLAEEKISDREHRELNNKSRTPLVLAIEGLRRSGMPGARRLTWLRKSMALNDPRHTWGDMSLGGGLTLLDMAADIGSPALVRRCLDEGCVVSERTRILAWRSANPKVIALLEKPDGDWVRPWADDDLECRLGIVVGLERSTKQFKLLQQQIASAQKEQPVTDRL